MKINLTTLIGIAVCSFGLFLGYHLKGGDFAALLDKTAMLIVVVGTAGAMIMGHPMSVVKNIPGVVKQVFFEKEFDYIKLIKQIETWSKVTRTEGVLALEKAIKEVEDPFLKTGLSYIIDSIEPENVEEFLEIDIEQMEARHGINAKFWENAGATAPTLGIMGAVMGLVVVLGGLGSASMEKLGYGISVALLATFLSLYIANAFFLPMANKLKLQTKKEVLYKEIAMKGLMAIQAQESPIMVKKKLINYLTTQDRVKYENEGKKNG